MTGPQLDSRVTSTCDLSDHTDAVVFLYASELGVWRLLTGIKVSGCLYKIILMVRLGILEERSNIYLAMSRELDYLLIWCSMCI